jgi:hypothetical protein
MDKKILEKLDVMDGRLDRVDVTLAEQALDLKHHISRTDTLQKMVEPLYKRDQQLIGIFKFLTGVGIIAGIVKGFKSFF